MALKYLHAILRPPACIRQVLGTHLSLISGYLYWHPLSPQANSTLKCVKTTSFEKLKQLKIMTVGVDANCFRISRLRVQLASSNNTVGIISSFSWQRNWYAFRTFKECNCKISYALAFIRSSLLEDINRGKYSTQKLKLWLGNYGYISSSLTIDL